MNAKHTPGPWSVGGKYAFRTVLLNARGESIASGGNNRSVQGPELEASLILASAAPDMLAACEALIKGDDLQVAIDLAHAAIAKATGGAA